MYLHVQGAILNTCGGPSPRGCIRNMLLKIMTVDVGKDVNWIGANGKVPFKTHMNTLKVMNGVYNVSLIIIRYHSLFVSNE